MSELFGTTFQLLCLDIPLVKQLDIVIDYLSIDKGPRRLT